jgi:hypothetical protein
MSLIFSIRLVSSCQWTDGYIDTPCLPPEGRGQIRKGDRTIELVGIGDQSSPDVGDFPPPLDVGQDMRGNHHAFL